MKPYQTITKRGTLWIHEHFATAEEAEREGYHFFFEDESNGPIYSVQMDDEGLYFHYARITDLHRYKVPCHWEMKGYLNVNARSVEKLLKGQKKKVLIAFCLWKERLTLRIHLRLIRMLNQSI